MQVLRTSEAATATINQLIANNRTVGFVPTMGALHDGHLALAGQSVSENDATIVSIFVNPKQFNAEDDFVNYPRDYDADIELLRQAGCDYVFLPSETEIYPDIASTVSDFDPGYLNTILEGQHRPGHFEGVALVVKRLFELIPATRAYFGQKDYQQLMVVRKLVQDFDIDIEIIDCPIVRDIHGLALSSRNQRLSDFARLTASSISKTLFMTAARFPFYTIENLKAAAVHYLSLQPGFYIEYFEICNADTLEILSQATRPSAGRYVIVTAVFVGEIRLIDNHVIT